MAATDEQRRALRLMFTHERPMIDPTVRFYSFWLEDQVADLQLEVNSLRVRLKRASSPAACGDYRGNT